MKKSDLSFEFPNELIATAPARPSRVLLNKPDQKPIEISIPELVNEFAPGDLLVINDTKVIPSRVIAETGEEFLFIKALGGPEWEVLFPARNCKPGKEFSLPGNLKVTLKEKGLPQKVMTSFPVTLEYFEAHGQVNLPPYILQERKEGRQNANDREWYQTKWAEHVGSVAAPTASLHFSEEDLNALKVKGVEVRKITLHVGLGTFFPLRAEELKDHQMHSEFVRVPKSVYEAALAKRKSGQRVWALGTTATRALESIPQGKISLNSAEDAFEGESDLFIYPPYEFKVVNGLLTNFHQPESTLLALVCAFFGTKSVKEAYTYAINERFRLFSYGDLSVWIR